MLKFIVVSFFSCWVMAQDNIDPNLLKYADFYKSRYGKEDLFTKIVDDGSNGFKQLYGVRNMRVVLHGVLYRGGAQNAHFNSSPRPNENPLQDGALLNLCREGFGQANYLYGTNFESAPPSVNCQDVFGNQREMLYTNLRYGSESVHKKIIQIIYNNIITYHGPIYMHCWNGWHASGFVSAIALKQFCGMTDNEAVLYWNRAADNDYGYSSQYHNDKRKAIRAFRPLGEYKISNELQQKICPIY